jgi:hypothetical protein
MSESMWVPCVKRQEIKKIGRDGNATPIHRCAHQATVRFGTNLKPGDCAGCPLRVFTPTVRPPGYAEKQANAREFGEPTIGPDGTLTYPRNGGWEPPRTPTGYRPKSTDWRSDDAWVFIPTWPPCVDREMANTVAPCGCIQINAMCASKESKRAGLSVTVEQCHQCSVRRGLEQVHQDESPV